jgi:hypothetical protein
MTPAAISGAQQQLNLHFSNVTIQSMQTIRRDNSQTPLSDLLNSFGLGSLLSLLGLGLIGIKHPLYQKPSTNKRGPSGTVRC